jgi:adenosylcobinamide-GDP ribazoletransferase
MSSACVIAEVLAHAIALSVLREFLLALQFLTIIQIKPTLPFDRFVFGHSAAFFPLIGAIVGAIVWGVDRALALVCPSSLQNVVIVALLTILSRGLHADGLADSADGLFGGHDRERRLAIMKDSRIGTFGALALLGVVLFKVRALDVLSDGMRASALLLGPTLSRWAYVVMAYRAVPARAEGLGSLLVNSVFFREFAIATGITLSVSILFGGIPGLPAMLLTLLWTLAMVSYCSARLGGVTGDTFGAVGEVAETATLCLYAVLASWPVAE